MLAQLTQAFGGLGLFLLGMWLMTEGLRLAAGPALERLLANWTRGRARGLLAGFFITALVQSSSAVIVATLGFVNAGILSFRRAVWVVFGSNVGTTLTAWLVALVGFKLKVDMLALPLVGIGALLRIFAPHARLQHLGMTLAGFGILFLGIQTLAEGFQGLGQGVSLAHGSGSVLLMLAIGVLLTTAMQSSSAAIALVLTAMAGGLVGLMDAAAVVIGASIGTTSTALIATLGATANARRLALAHVLFNVITAVVALAMLPFVLAPLASLMGEPALTLAAFHTAFKCLGVLLIWPLEPFMSRWLLQRFQAREARTTELHYLDRNVAAVPHLAQRALVLELEAMLREYPALVDGLPRDDSEQQARALARRQRLDKLADFLTRMSGASLGDELTDRQARIWRVQHNLLNIEESLTQISEALHRLNDARARVLRERLRDWLGRLAHGLDEVLSSAPAQADFSPLSETYERAKMEVLGAGLGGTVPRTFMDQALQACSQSRRLAEQWLRAYTNMAVLGRMPDGQQDPVAADGAQASRGE